MGIGINFELNWDCITLRYMENNTVALRIILGVYIINYWPTNQFARIMINIITTLSEIINNFIIPCRNEQFINHQYQCIGVTGLC